MYDLAAPKLFSDVLSFDECGVIFGWITIKYQNTEGKVCWYTSDDVTLHGCGR